MASQKLVRCEIRHREGNSAGSARYVPLEIFGLWEHLMRSRHAFDVMDARASLWLDTETSPDSAYTENQFERVTEVTAFVYSERDDMFTRICRYFPTDQCEQLKGIFLSHYTPAAGLVQPQVRERAGIWIHRGMGAAAATG